MTTPITDHAARCELIATELRHLGHMEAYAEHSGGGIFCVYVPSDFEAGGGPECWIFGMANETWAGHRIDASGEYVAGTDLETSIPSDTSDPAQLRAVAAQIDRYLRNL